MLSHGHMQKIKKSFNTRDYATFSGVVYVTKMIGMCNIIVNTLIASR